MRFASNARLSSSNTILHTPDHTGPEGTEFTPRKLKNPELMRVWKKMVELQLVPKYSLYDGSRQCYSRDKISEENMTVTLEAARPGRRPFLYDVTMTQVARVKFSMISEYIEKKIPLSGDVLAAVQRVMKINGISRKSADAELFNYSPKPEDEKVEISVAKYYALHKNITLMHPRSHCADLGRAGMIPLELLAIAPDTKHRGKLNDKQTATVIKTAAKKPFDRLQMIQDAIKSTMQYANDPYLANLGIRVQSEPMSVSGRMLPTPSLQYGANRTVVPNGGVWNLNNVKVYQGLEIASLGIAIVRGGRGGRAFTETMARDFITNFSGFASRMDVKIQSSVARRCPIATIQQGASIEQSMRRLYSDTSDCFRLDPQLIIVILPDSNASVYAEVKRAGDVVLGVSTQCLQGQKIEKVNAGYMANVALKVNVKCPGMVQKNDATPESRHVYYNTSLAKRSSLLQRPTMVVGLDVDHAGPGSLQPSIAAMVGSMDPNAVRFSSVCQLLPGRVEILGDLVKPMMVELVKRFKAATNHMPERILFYRDGVSDGEFAQVETREVAGLRNAFKECGISPKLTFVVAKKRHHTRFFPNRGDADRTGNLAPGFVLDRVITSADSYDFFLQSQAGIQGMSRPTHYYVLVDEIAMPADELQQFTFGLCHTQQRCTRAVGIVAPIFYADLLGKRSRGYMRASDDESLSSEVQAAGQMQLAPVHKSIAKFMYFM